MTPSTSRATSSPNSLRTSSSSASVSSTVSCSSAAVIVAESSFSSAQISATAQRVQTNGSPLLRTWPAWWSQA